MKCPHCLSEIPDEARACRYCGRAVVPFGERKAVVGAQNVMSWVIFGFAVLCVIIAAVYVLS